MELEDRGIVRGAVYSGPSAGSGAGEVPEEDAAAHGGAEGKEGRAVGGDIRCGVGEEENGGRQKEEGKLRHLSENAGAQKPQKVNQNFVLRFEEFRAQVSLCDRSLFHVGERGTVNL